MTTATRASETPDGSFVDDDDEDYDPSSGGELSDEYASDWDKSYYKNDSDCFPDFSPEKNKGE